MEIMNFSSDAITSETELRELIGFPHEYVVKKSVSILNEQCKQFISKSPLFFLSTSNSNGKCDVSPRGDLHNTIKILNDKQFVIPDRPGNKRLDSLINILSNPHVGIVFVIPGLDEVLRVNGEATIIKNKDILDDMLLNGKPPKLGIGVNVTECFIHCARALQKAKIWDSTTWPNKEALPTSLEIFHSHLELNGISVKKNH